MGDAGDPVSVMNLIMVDIAIEWTDSHSDH